MSVNISPGDRVKVVDNGRNTHYAGRTGTVAEFFDNGNVRVDLDNSPGIYFVVVPDDLEPIDQHAVLFIPPFVVGQPVMVADNGHNEHYAGRFGGVAQVFENGDVLVSIKGEPDTYLVVAPGDLVPTGANPMTFHTGFSTEGLDPPPTVITTEDSVLRPIGGVEDVRDEESGITIEGHLTTAAGWCTPSETFYDLPDFTARRGGIQFGAKTKPTKKELRRKIKALEKTNRRQSAYIDRLHQQIRDEL